MDTLRKLCLLFGLLAGLSAWGNQNTALLEADAKNRSGSDKSLEKSAVSAMSALMDLASMNVSGAIKNGTEAYGKYRNSETMDKIGDQSFNSALSLESMKGSGVTGPRKTETSFRRLDSNFLREGEAAKVAAEFEKKSGMPREQFLKHLAEVSEKKIPRSDPELVDKVLSRFENFAQQIPNAEFRKNITKATSAVPSTVRNGLIAKAVSKFANLFDSAASNVSPSGSYESVASTAPDNKADPSTVASPEPATGANRQPAAAAGTATISTNNLGTLSAPQAGDSVKDPNNPLGSVVQAALATQGQDLTLFQQVHRKYQTLAPAF